MSTKSVFQLLPEIEQYFRKFDPSLPPLKFEDKNKDGQMNLFDSLGNEHSSSFREVPAEWAHLLRPIAINHHESPGVALTAKDWLTHKQSLNFGKSGRVILPNGLQVIVEHDPERPFVRVGYVPLVGSIDELPAQRGISHGLEHVLIGSGPFGGRKEITDCMTQLGAGRDSDSVNTYYERTLYSFYVESSHLREVFLMWDATLMNENYDQKRVSDEINDILGQEIRRHDSNVSSCVWTNFLKGLYPEHPFGDDVSGNFSQVQALTLNDFRDHHAKTHVPNNVTIKFHGPITMAEAVRLVQESRIGKMRSRAVIRPLLSLQNVSKPVVEIIPSKTKKMPPTKTTEVKIGWRIPIWLDRSNDAALDVAINILNTRLDQRLVTTGQLNTASIGSKSLGGVGSVVVSLSGSADKISDQIVELQKMVEQIRRYAPSSAEVESARRELLSSDAFDQEKSSRHIMPALQESRHVDPIENRRIWLDGIARVTGDDVRLVAQNYLDSTNSYTLVILEEGKQPAQFVSSEDLLKRMQAARNQPPTSYDFEAGDRLIYSHTEIPEQLDIGKVLKEQPQRLRDGRVRYLLKNGLSVTYVPTKSGKVIVSQIRSSLGDGTDPIGKEGVRALIKSNLFRGTAEISLKAFEQEMNFLGAKYSAQLSEDHFTIFLSTPTGDFLDAAQLLLHVIQHPRFGDKDLSETKLALDGVRKDTGNNFSLISTYIPQAELYPSPRVMRLTTGSPASVASISRDDLFVYRQQLLDPSKLQVTLGGNFSSPKEFEKFLYLLSQIPSNASLPTLADGAIQSILSYPFEVIPITDPSKLESIGVERGIKVTHTPREVDSVYVSQQTLGPVRNSWEYPYFYAFQAILGDRNFYRLVYGKREGREDVKGYLYLAWTLGRIVELDQPVLAGYQFECTPDQIKKVLADYRDEYLQITGEHKPTQADLKKAVEELRLRWLQSNDTTSGKVGDSINKDQSPYYFKDSTGRVLEVRDLAEVFRRLAQLPIEDVIRIGGKYFDMSRSMNGNPLAHLHIVGKLPVAK